MYGVLVMKINGERIQFDLGKFKSWEDIKKHAKKKVFPKLPKDWEFHCLTHCNKPPRGELFVY